ncbi:MULTISPECIES: TlpA family protein disulfide reductase [Microbacterium]|uniref:TlpA family protein disulfide reductase n=1 Tax=Microbacterium TaxID=33882 RepID=UPI00217EEF89|nr:MULTISPECIES: TlpA disulfide reductase family protein [Microbacterium]UWF77833.1 TlpA family protein disulfide reductase [Microbacterium neungamense]WCM56009.1 TlpA family protein disulfide reductase [Microbacterium sp. EF45047]
MPLASTVRPVRSGRPRRRIRSLRAAGAALAAVLAVGLAACAPDPLTESYRNGEQKAYTADDFRVTEIPADERGEPVEFGGVTEDGAQFSSDDVRGKVTVVNFWYAACGPCRIEAEDLEAVWQEHQDDEVAFIGVNIYDQADTAKAFAERYGVTYPSLIDANSGEAKLAFAKVTPIQAPPVTLVLDRDGRVAARIIGPIDGTSILSTLVRDALAESA